jgi:hypothetical protein
VALLVLVVIAAAGGYGYLHYVRDDDGGATAQPEATPKVCPTAPAPPAPGAVTIRLFNGTARDGLGASVAADLATRGFVLAPAANAPAPNPGRTKVTYAVAGTESAAQLVAAQVVDADVAVDPAVPPGGVDVVLGDGFTRLRTPQEALTAFAALPAPPC